MHVNFALVQITHISIDRPTYQIIKLIIVIGAVVEENYTIIYEQDDLLVKNIVQHVGLILHV